MKEIEQYLSKHPQWSAPLKKIHEVIIATELSCSIKWRAPVYDLDGKNVVGLGAFKQHFGIWFFQGVFLKDEAKVLVNAQEGKTKALRQLKFNDENEVDLAIVKAYVEEAIANQKAGKEVKVDRTATFTVPNELKAAFQNDASLKQSFDALTKGKQKEYCNYIHEAKRDQTKASRIEKIKPMIAQGIGLYDKYKNC